MQIWMAELDRPLTETEYAALLRELPPVRRERLLRTQNVTKHREPLCAYWLLKKMLQQKYGFDEIPEIAFGSAGKPYFPAFPHIHFNISHTDGAVIVALGDAPVGVDIEKIRPVSQRMMERVPCGEQAEEFFRCWVRQEACAKCSGTGIAEFLHGEAVLPAERRYFALDTFSGYVAGITMEREEQAEAVHRLIWSRDLAWEVTDFVGKD